MLRRRIRLTLLAIACVALLAGCSTKPEPSAPRLEGPACTNACDSAFDACSHACTQSVEDDLCAEECLAKLGHCHKRCE